MVKTTVKEANAPNKAERRSRKRLRKTKVETTEEDGEWVPSDDEQADDRDGDVNAASSGRAMPPLQPHKKQRQKGGGKARPKSKAMLDKLKADEKCLLDQKITSMAVDVCQSRLEYIVPAVLAMVEPQVRKEVEPHFQNMRKLFMKMMATRIDEDVKEDHRNLFNVSENLKMAQIELVNTEDLLKDLRERLAKEYELLDQDKAEAEKLQTEVDQIRLQLQSEGSSLLRQPANFQRCRLSPTTAPADVSLLDVSGLSNDQLLKEVSASLPDLRKLHRHISTPSTQE